MNMKAVKCRYYLPLEKGAALHLNKLESPLPIMVAVSWVPSLDKIGPVALELLLYFRYYLPLKMGVVLHLYKLESQTPKDA